MKNWKEVSPFSGIEEDAPANWAGGGNVHGIGVGPHGEPGIDPKKKKKKLVLIDREGKTLAFRVISNFNWWIFFIHPCGQIGYGC